MRIENLRLLLTALLIGLIAPASQSFAQEQDANAKTPKQVKYASVPAKASPRETLMAYENNFKASAFKDCIQESFKKAIGATLKTRGSWQMAWRQVALDSRNCNDFHKFWKFIYFKGFTSPESWFEMQGRLMILAVAKKFTEDFTLIPERIEFYRKERAGNGEKSRQRIINHMSPKERSEHYRTIAHRIYLLRQINGAQAAAKEFADASDKAVDGDDGDDALQPFYDRYQAVIDDDTAAIFKKALEPRRKTSQKL